MTAKRSEEIATLAQAAGGCKAHEGGICPTKTVDSPDFGQLEPMVDPTEAEPEATGVKEKPEVVLADTGYWHQE